MYGASHRLVIALLLVTVIFCSLYGLNAIGRSSEVLLIVLILCLVPFIFAIASTGIFKIENLIPVLAEGLPIIPSASVRTTFFPFGELIVFLMLFQYLSKEHQKGILKRSYVAILMTLLLLIGVGLTNIALLGSNLVRNFAYPFYSAMQLAGMNGFLERLDPLAIIIMVVSEYFKLVIYFNVAILGIQALHQKFNFKVILWVLSVLVFIFAPFMTFSQDVLLNTLPLKIMPIFEFAIPLIIWMVSEIKHRKKKKEQLAPA